MEQLSVGERKISDSSVDTREGALNEIPLFKSTSRQKTSIVVYSIVIISLTSCVWVTPLHRQIYKEQSRLLTTTTPAKQQGGKPEVSMERRQPADWLVVVRPA